MIVALLPAAGASRRMGRPKLLLPWEAGSVLDRILETLAASRVDRTLVLLPALSEECPESPAAETLAALSDTVRRWHARALPLPQPTADMLGTLRVGIRSARELWGLGPGDGLLVMPADLPTLPVEVIDLLIDRFQTGAGPLLVPMFHGRRGHPLLLAGSLSEEILQLPAGVGLNTLVRSDPKRVVECAVEHAEILDDLDTPEDYRRLTERRGARPLPPGSRV